MSYDLGLRDQGTGEWIELGEPHQMQGGTYQLGGCTTAEINITYNYCSIISRVLPDRLSDHEQARDGRLRSIRVLYGLTGAESIPMLQKAISELGDDTDPDYWRATEGNVKAALRQCLALAQMRPDGVWDGD
jgi:hypothetical protein